ncbi:AAA domain-containing protein [Methylobacterium sp. WL120]|uniref:AAA domain-containing protein n=1 Tax=Methylobacterium sp. WL120 TaxID=2603887 RepID=UPI0011CC9AB6|nr:AAA domain-containing protein [Methylobacterium sp. WL120]TXM64396.1 AAA family ATPase [Methylobacterium sp. WL120]
MADPASGRLHDLLGYVEQVVRLDERAAMRLSEHRLPTGQAFILHQHELHALPGVRHDLVDEEGPIWLSVQRLWRSAAPAPPEEAAEWLELAPDPERRPRLLPFLIQTIPMAEKNALVSAGLARVEDCSEAPIQPEKDVHLWDVRLRIEDRADVQAAAEAWITERWLPWSLAEGPVRHSLALYQRLFEVAQLSELGGGDRPFELVWGMGLARWKKDDREIDLPLVERLIEIEVDDAGGAEIRIRPRAAAAAVNLRAYEDMGVEGVMLAHDAARRAIAVLDPDEGISPYRRDDFEPILRSCQARLDVEGGYLPDRLTLAPHEPVPGAGENLTVSDRWVVFARNRSDSFLLADIENLKRSVKRAAEEHDLPGPARTLVMGPADKPSDDLWRPLSDRVGGTVDQAPESVGAAEVGDLFFPKPFNDEQMEIVRRLEATDGIVVQGPPGTGKTHTISNIICHYMATGRRVLVVSHGEPALAVLRDQLPDGVRDLAISITATEREGFRQLEAAVRLLQSVVESIKPSEQSRLIRDLEASVVGLRGRLNEVDAEIERFALRQLSPAFGDERPAELARRVTLSAVRHDWFEDRPGDASLDAMPRDEDVAGLRTARLALGARLEHIDCALPSIHDLPDGDVIARLHDDLVRSIHLAEEAASDPSIRVRIMSPKNVAQALEAASELGSLRRAKDLVDDAPWLRALAEDILFAADENRIVDLVRRFAEDARPIALERERYLGLPVELPEALEPSSQEIAGIVRRLAAEEPVFGFFAFREKSLRPIVDAIRVQGRPPVGPGDWAHVRDHLAWRDAVASLAIRWRALADEIGASPFATARELGQLVGTLDAILVGAERATRVLGEAFADLVPGGGSVRDLWLDRRRLDLVEKAFRNAAAAAQLSASRNEIDRLQNLFPETAGKIGQLARDVLSEAVGRQGVGAEQISSLWSALRRQIDDLGQGRGYFEVVRSITEVIRLGGAPVWASRLRREPAQDTTDPLLPGDWREAWEWAVTAAYLRRIDDRDRLRTLADERVRLDAEVRKTFERLVRERTFYELGRSMTGTVRAALMMFATALRKTGKGTGKGAGRHRRDARLAMAQCYAAIPCWIMPAWRVAEQLPGEVGSFDLVIMDEASQSDIRELPALLRGRKILVVGDDKQVSPSAAFIENAKIDRLEHGFLKGQPFRTLLLPGASLYDLAKVMFPDKLVMLREHFRCVEPIIRFSMEFYPEPLVPLRVPTAHERLDPPLIDIYVPDGRRKGDKQNPREAEVIVAEIRKLVDDPSLARIEAQDRWRTIGVVSLIGSKQAALVNKMLLEELGEDLVRRHRIACGDSATFQGNERDVVFLSMIADPDSKQAQTATQFAQRFNVAMSRARDRLVLVRSVQEDELKPDDLKARVIRHFRDPMAGVEARTGDLEALCDSDFERDVLRRLVGRGYRVLPQVGALGYRIDLVVEGANGRRLAVECDGDRYHGPERWADDMRRQRILERVGWRFWRCWSSSFILDPDGCMLDLFETLERAGIEPGGAAELQSGYTLHLTAARSGDTVGRLHDASPNDSAIEPSADHDLQVGSGKLKGDHSAGGVKAGDRIVLRYLDDNKTVTFTLAHGHHDEANGRLPVNSPLGSKLLGVSEEDEIEFDAGGRIRRVLVLRTERPQAPH